MDLVTQNDEDEVIPTLDSTRFHALLLTIDHADLRRPDSVLARARRTHEREELGIAALVSNAPLSRPLLTYGTGADQCIRREEACPKQLAMLLAALASGTCKALDGILAHHHLHLTRASREVRVGSRIVRLTPSQFDLLWSLARRTGEVVSMADLLPGCRALTQMEQRRIVQVAVHRLRKQLGPLRDLVETVIGSGYRLNMRAHLNGIRRG